MIAADIDGLAPALYLADRALRVPPVRGPGYIDALLEAVTAYKVSLIVPTIDLELPTLSEDHERFGEHGCTVLVSSPCLVRIANDKWPTFREFSARRFRLPRYWLPGEVHADELPARLFVKPRDGSASQHAYQACPETLEHVLVHVPNPIVQEYMTGPELTIDALLDLAGRPVHYVVRRRIKAIGGELYNFAAWPCCQLFPFSWSSGNAG